MIQAGGGSGLIREALLTLLFVLQVWASSKQQWAHREPPCEYMKSLIVWCSSPQSLASRPSRHLPTAKEWENGLPPAWMEGQDVDIWLNPWRLQPDNSRHGRILLIIVHQKWSNMVLQLEFEAGGAVLGALVQKVKVDFSHR